MQNKLPLLSILACTLLISCTTAKEINTPSGSAGYAIKCNGKWLDWSNCYEKAGEVCGENGYTIIDERKSSNPQVYTITGRVFADNVTNRSLMIECN